MYKSYRISFLKVVKMQKVFQDG